jgi:hypothetical protein
MARYKVKGINDEQDTCMCCGKTGLKRVVWIEDTDTGDINHFGTTCAKSPAKAIGIGREIDKAVREYVSARKRKAIADHHAKIREACEVAERTFPGEWIEKTIERGAMKGRVVRYPADQDAYEAFKKGCIAQLV